jgi:uncharacterized protein (TIGR02145 family)
MKIMGAVLNGVIILALSNCLAQAPAVSPAFKDIEGNVYQGVKIGNQVWITENYRSTKLNDGTPLPLVIDSAKWCNLKSPGYCWYKNSIANKKKCGALYNWYAISSKKFAPKGWHIPSEADWDTLENYLIANNFNCYKVADDHRIAKALAGKTDWQENNPYANDCIVGKNMSENNRSGFAALPSGIRQNGSFVGLGEICYFWYTQEKDNDLPTGSIITLRSEDEFALVAFEIKSCGCSVRLIKD